MALSVSNNNGGAPITQDGTYCAIQVPGYIPPDIAGPGGSSPVFGSASYYIATGLGALGTTVTFQAMTSDGAWNDLADPAPIKAQANQIYNASLSSAAYSALRISVAGVGQSGITYAQLSGSPERVLLSSGPTQSQIFKSGDCSTELSIDPVGGDLIATATAGPNAGKSVNLTYGKWT